MASIWEQVEQSTEFWLVKTDQELHDLYNLAVSDLRNHALTGERYSMGWDGGEVRHMKYAAWFEINRRKKVKTHFLCYFEDHVSTFRMFEPRLAKTICNYAC